MIVSATVLIILFIFPGLIFRYVLFQGTSKKIRISNLDHIYWAVIKALFLHVIFISIIYHFEDLPEIDFKVLESLFRSELHSNEETLVYSFRFIIIYFTSILLVSIFFAALLRFIIIRFGLYQWHTFFVIDNYWEMLIDSVYNGAAFVVVDILISGDNRKNYIYTGVVDDYDVDDKENLNSIFIFDVYRRDINEDLKEETKANSSEVRVLDERYYKVKGDLLAIRSDQINNLNITYVFDIDTTS